MLKIREMLTGAPGHWLRALSGKIFIKICVTSALKIETFDFFKK